VDHLRLCIERRADHWAIGVLNRTAGVWLYRAQCSSEGIGRSLLIDFASSELGRSVLNTELIWVCLLWDDG
jgi:hypothetical protein